MAALPAHAAVYGLVTTTRAAKSALEAHSVPLGSAVSGRPGIDSSPER